MRNEFKYQNENFDQIEKASLIWKGITKIQKQLY